MTNDDELSVCATEVEEIVDSSELINSDYDAEIDHETPIKTVAFFNDLPCLETVKTYLMTATAGSDVVQSGRPIFDDFFQHLWPYIGNNTANVVFQMVKRLWLIHIDQ
ncbi:hypothetical protein TNCV_4445411 [Trichonephila clavipes]|nr:hypothetical protein TNCV_4445411 [Trichonephila clavipes]